MICWADQLPPPPSTASRSDKEAKHDPNQKKEISRKIQTKSKIKKPGFIILEILPENSDKIVKLARSYFPDGSFSVFEDLSKKPRVLLGRIA